MDKRTIIGFVLIGLIIILYPIYMEWLSGGKRVQEVPLEPQTQVDTVARAPLLVEEAKETPLAEPESHATGLAMIDVLEEEKTVRVETDLYIAEFYKSLRNVGKRS